MNYLISFFIIIISLELFLKFKFITLIESIFKLNKKAFKLIMNKRISDHWKGKIIPEYSIGMAKISIIMLLILSVITLLFVLAGFLFEEFSNFILSFKGIIYSMIFAFAYLYFKKLLKNEQL